MLRTSLLSSLRRYYWSPSSSALSRRRRLPDRHHQQQQQQHQHSHRHLSGTTTTNANDIREQAKLQEDVIRRLDATVQDPAFPTRSIVDLGLVKVCFVTKSSAARTHLIYKSIFPSFISPSNTHIYTHRT